MSNEKYNGWTNRETWLVNLHWGDTITEIFEEIDLQTLTECIEDFVWESIQTDVATNSPAMDFIDLGVINWRELAEHCISELTLNQ